MYVERSAEAFLGQAKEDVRHFRAVDRLNLPVGAGALLCLASQTLPLTAQVQAVPLWAL